MIKFGEHSIKLFNPEKNNRESEYASEFTDLDRKHFEKKSETNFFDE
jgi:hypothetical protein